MLEWRSSRSGQLVPDTFKSDETLTDPGVGTAEWPSGPELALFQLWES